MKKGWVLALFLAATLRGGAAAGEVLVEVTGDRVSVRAAPELNAVLLTRATMDEQLVLCDNTNREWVGVLPPERVDCWVHSEFLEAGRVIPPRLNIRSGPSLNHTVVGVVRSGKELAIRGEIGGWVKIAPPEETVAWISRQYCRLLSSPSVAPSAKADPEPQAVSVVEAGVVQEAAPESEKMFHSVIQVVPSPEPEPAEEVREPMRITSKEVQPEINEVMVSASVVFDVPDALVPDPKKKQGADWSFVGLLMPEKGVLSKLVDSDTGQVLICYVRGNAAQLETFFGRRMSIFGRTYWAQGMERPFVVPVTIQVMKD